MCRPHPRSRPQLGIAITISIPTMSGISGSASQSCRAKIEGREVAERKCYGLGPLVISQLLCFGQLIVMKELIFRSSGLAGGLAEQG